MIRDRLRRTLPEPLRQRLLATTLAASIAAGGVAALTGASVAQDDGTGASTPTPPSDCRIVPARVDPLAATATPVASPVPDEATPLVIGPAGTPVSTQATPAATPVAGFATPAATPLVVPGTPVASPVPGDATPAASPVAQVDPLTAEITDTANALFGCLNERNFETYAQLTSDEWRGALFGSVEPLPADLFVDLAQTLPNADHRIEAITAVEVSDATTVTAEVTYVSAYQQRTGRWTFTKETVDGLPAWVLAAEEPLPVTPTAGAASIDLTFEDAGYVVSPQAVTGPDVVLNLDNPTSDDHEALVLRLDEGVSTDILLQGGILPDGITLIGQATVPAGAAGTMYLVNLPPGTYTIVDLLPDANGVPNLAAGMTATFTVNP